MIAVRSRIVALLSVVMVMVMFSSAALAQSVTVVASKSEKLGDVLTDSQGRVLYLFLRDSPNVSSACYNRCATTWPPLLITEGNPIAGNGANGNLLGVLTRTDGTRQVMYNGWPLYYFANDAKAGDTNGQGVNKVWYAINLVDSAGTPGQPPAAPAPAPAAPAPAAPAPAAPAPAAPAPAAPAELPRTGGAEAQLPAMLLLAFVLLCVGASFSVRAWRHRV